MVTAEEIRQLQKESTESYIERTKERIISEIKEAAKNREDSIEVHHHTLLEPFFNELISNGFKIKVIHAFKVLISW